MTDCECVDRLARELLAERRGPILKARLASSNASVSGLLGPGDGLELVGFSLTEDAGAVARARLTEGTGGSNDAELFDVQLNANESTREWFATDPRGAGIPIPGGLSVVLVSGTIRGTIYYRMRAAAV